jgi:hypothetical protein
MTIEMPAEAVYALAAALREQAGTAEEAHGRLAGGGARTGDLHGAVEEFLAAHRLGASALAGELRDLASTVAGVADSWLGLDEVLLAARGRAPRR